MPSPIHTFLGKYITWIFNIDRTKIIVGCTDATQLSQIICCVLVKLHLCKDIQHLYMLCDVSTVNRLTNSPINHYSFQVLRKTFDVSTSNRLTNSPINHNYPNFSFKNFAVYDSLHESKSSGFPVNTTLPPFSPPSGPMSITQSAHFITSRLCSITTTV